MRFVAIIVSWILLLPSVAVASGLSKEEGMAVVKDFERLSNISPQDVEAKAPDVLSRLRNGESPASYFIAYNIYVENLFNKGKVDKARQEMAQMLKEATDQESVECKVIALRTEGQFYYKLGLYERASDCFRKAIEACPRYDCGMLESCFTWSSTLFWLVQTDIHTGRLEEAEHWIGQMDDMMKWLDSRGDTDAVGYKPVMIRGLKAKIELQRGNLEEARRLLQECPEHIRDDIPSRAYVEYYVAMMQLYVKEGRHEEALPVLDELIEMHMDDYKPIAAEYLHQKGLSLAALGRYEESAETLMEYIRLHDQVNEVALTQQLDELSALYVVEKLQHERDNIRRQLLIVVAICVAMAIIITMTIRNQRRLRRKNQTLANSISELNRLNRELPLSANGVDAADKDADDADLIETGTRIVEFIEHSGCYLHADCSRDTIKDGTGVSERILSKAIVAATGLSFVNYINELRLKVSIEMLEGKPDMTIGDISTACGFGTVRQFQRIFKQRYGLSPSAYRDARRSSMEDAGAET